MEPNHTGILIGLANLYLEKKDNKEVREKNDSDKASDTDGRATYYSKALKYYKQAKELLEKDDDVGYLLALEDLAITMDDITEEDFTKTEKVLKAAREKDYQSAESYSNLGVFYTHKKDFGRAIKYFEKAANLEPYDIELRNQLASVYLKDKKTEEAEEEYKKIFEITTNNIESHIGLGEVYTAMGEKDEDMYNKSIHHFTEAVKLAESKNRSKRLKGKEFAAVYYSRGYARVKFYEASKISGDQRLLQQALDDFKRCIEKDPDHYKARRAKEKLEESLRSFTPQWLTEKVAPWLIFSFSLIVFGLSQWGFFSDMLRKSAEGDSGKSINAAAYISLTFGTLVFMVVGFYLPQILKLKIAGIELEKSPVTQVTTTRSLGISK